MMMMHEMLRERYYLPLRHSSTVPEHLEALTSPYEGERRHRSIIFPFKTQVIYLQLAPDSAYLALIAKCLEIPEISNRKLHPCS